MSEIEKQLDAMQSKFIQILNLVNDAIKNKQYDIAQNIIKEEVKTLEADLIEKNKELA